LRILFVGDVVGKPGRRILRQRLVSLKQEFAADLTIANGENLAAGLGATPQLVRDIQGYGVQIVTMGNHTWKRADLAKGIDSLEGIVRPANYPPDSPGVGSIVYDIGGGRLVGVFNLVGRIYMDAADCPFRAGLRIAEELKRQTPIVIVDMHAEATSEKVAMGIYLDGKVSAVFGTHTHVQTSDERILPGGTAYITDVGMTGPKRTCGFTAPWWKWTIPPVARFPSSASRNASRICWESSDCRLHRRDRHQRLRPLRNLRGRDVPP